MLVRHRELAAFAADGATNTMHDAPFFRLLVLPAAVEFAGLPPFDLLDSAESVRLGPGDITLETCIMDRIETNATAIVAEPPHSIPGQFLARLAMRAKNKRLALIAFL